MDSPAKISAAILEFAEPLTRAASSPSDYEAGLSTAIIAWNLALLPETNRATPLSRFLAETTADEEEQSQIREVVEAMIARKDVLFGDVRRFIVRYMIKREGGQVRLSVSSAPLKGEEG